MSLSPCTSPNFEHAWAEGVTNLFILCFCFVSGCREKGSLLLKGIVEVNKEEEGKHKNRGLWNLGWKLCWMITEDDNALYLIQSTLPSSPAGSTNNCTLVQTSHLLTACPLLSVGVWLCKKRAKPGSGYLCNFLSDLSLPHKTSSPKHPDFPCCALGHTSPCEELWLRREAGQSPETSQVVVFDPGFSSQGLLWPEALPCCEN